MCEPSVTPRLLREAQILQMLSISKTTLRRWRRSGYFPAGIKLRGRITVWPIEVVEAFIGKL